MSGHHYVKYYEIAGRILEPVEEFVTCGEAHDNELFPLKERLEQVPDVVIVVSNINYLIHTKYILSDMFHICRRNWCKCEGIIYSDIYLWFNNYRNIPKGV